MRSRIHLLIGILGLVAVIWIGYIFVVMMLDPLKLEEERFKRNNPAKALLIPLRGSILDANGNLLVSSVSYYQVDVNLATVRKWITDNHLKITEDNVYKAYSIIMSKCIPLDREYIYNKIMTNKTSHAVMIHNKIKESDKEYLFKIFKDKNLPGLVATFSSQKRIYSKGISTARVLGSVREITTDKNPENPMDNMYRLIGACGLEATYDKVLAGQYGWRQVFLNARELPVPYPNLREKKPVPGYNLWLTIDGSIQDIVEDALAEGLQQYGAKNAAAVVLEVPTGRVLAMAGVSADDYSEDPGFVRMKSNIPVSFMFEPGSTMKPFTALTAVEYHLVSPTEKFMAGRCNIRGRDISDSHPSGPLCIREVISHSSNVGIALIGERVGSKRLYDKLIALGYGQKSPLNLFGESRGMLSKLESWSGYSLSSISFGQEISVTPIQLAVAYATIANEGKMMRPYIVDSYRDETGKVIKQFEPKVMRVVSSKAAADTLRSYLQSVVEEGTAHHIKLNYVSLAGKTGTAEKKVAGSQGYAKGAYTGNFCGFFPVEKPQMVCLVLYDEPAGGFYYGAQCAAPTFQKIVEKVLFLPQCQILPQSKKMQQNTMMTPQLIGLNRYQAESILKQNGLTYKISGSDSLHLVTDQYPKANVALDKSHPILLVLGKKLEEDDPIVVTGVMPNLHNFTLRKAMQVANINNIKLKIKGMGIVRRQSIMAGSSVIPGSTCIVEASL